MAIFIGSASLEELSAMPWSRVLPIGEAFTLVSESWILRSIPLTHLHVFLENISSLGVVNEMHSQFAIQIHIQ